MRVLVNTLSIGSLSGQHVVMGFLSQLIPWTRDQHEFVLLHDASSPPPSHLCEAHVETVPVSPRLRHWALRTVWESTQLRRLVRDTRADLLLNPSGALLPNVPVPQVVLCQNPWCFVPAAQKGPTERFKAYLQRRGYRRAFSDAHQIFFISDHLRSLYRESSTAIREAPSDIAYVGIGQQTWSAADRLQSRNLRQPDLIVAVSAMARWKGVETLISAVEQLRNSGCPARLRLVGPWPDPEYAATIRHQIAAARLQDAIEITGQVSLEDLYRSYAEARVFSLLSHCESFGIPAAEAQVFGTPAVVTTGCAMPEVCGAGALTVPPDSPNAAGEAIRQLLEDDTAWQHRSQAALENAERFRWDVTTRPLLRMFESSHSPAPVRTGPAWSQASA